MDDDVNMLDNADVFEAMFTQTNPARDVTITSKSHPAMTLATSAFEKEGLEKFLSAGTALTRKLIVESTTKEEPPLGVKRTRFETLYPPDLQKWVVDNWQRLGFTQEANGLTRG